MELTFEIKQRRQWVDLFLADLGFAVPEVLTETQFLCAY